MYSGMMETPLLEFLGLRLSSKVVSIIPEYISAILNWPLVTTKRETMSFLGSINYYADFIVDLAEMARPLYEVLKRKCREDEFIPFSPEEKAELTAAMTKLKTAV